MEQLERLRHYLAMREARPLSGLSGMVHGIHSGTEWEAELHLSDIVAVCAYAGELRSTMNEMLDLYDMHLRWGEIIERARKLTTPEGGGRNG